MATLFKQICLYDTLKERAYDLDVPKIKKEDYTYLTDNIKHSFYYWQHAAINNFLLYEGIKKAENDTTPTHLLFNLATGAGKTLLMAAAILHYYREGYRHFIFFVNQNNIVGKTEDNLINTDHPKYLFTPNIVIGNKSVSIKKVDSFSDNPDDIEIIFTSIHKLHNAVYIIKENGMLLEYLQNRPLVLLGDEAHNLNASTKKIKGEIDFKDLELKDSSKAEDVERSWENTVIRRILNRDGKPKTNALPNVLLEFTATVPTDNAVLAKYIDKIICKFDLRDFLNAGYTKNINLVSSNFDKKQRVLQALLFNWYRYEIAKNHNIPHFKPVILFRSKFADSKKEENSQKDFDLFKDIIANLSPDDFSFLELIKTEGLFNLGQLYQKGQSRMVDIKQYITNNNISFQQIIDYLQYTFQAKNCIITNSRTNTTQIEKTDDATNKLLNSLEDKHNPITAIFTVKRLTEGWDVLNLFDIVRMYEGQNTGGSSKGKTSEATVSEVQLIGRGVRYYPFKYNDFQPNKRKFDRDRQHDLSILEEFYFHSDANERYLSDLSQELKRQQLVDDSRIEITFKFKEAFSLEKEDSPFRKIKLLINKQLDNPNRRKRDLDEIRQSFIFEYTLKDDFIKEAIIDINLQEDKTLYESEHKSRGTAFMRLKDFDRQLVMKAIHIHSLKASSLFRFENAKKEFAINSIHDLLTDAFLNTFRINIISSTAIHDIEAIDRNEQLKIIIAFLDKIEIEVNTLSNPYIGDDFKSTDFSTVFPDSKTILVEKDPESETIAQEIKGKDWYVLDNFYGTSEEKALYRYLETVMNNLSERYSNIWLLRNERVYKMYDFEQGRGFEPDFLLFLKDKQEKELYYQLFIEPKGNNLLEHDQWKNDFLVAITTRYGTNNILQIQGKHYNLTGLPLFNEKQKGLFSDDFNFFLHHNKA